MPPKPARHKRPRLVFEIGTEELPAAAAWAAARQIREMAPEALRAARIPCGAVAAWSTPRRIVLAVEEMALRQEDAVREVRGPAALLGREIVSCRFADVEAGRRTYGHRVLSPRPITVQNAQGFEAALRRGYVLLDPEARRRRITESAIRAARRAGGHPILDPNLLE